MLILVLCAIYLLLVQGEDLKSATVFRFVASGVPIARSLTLDSRTKSTEETVFQRVCGELGFILPWFVIYELIYNRTACKTRRVAVLRAKIRIIHEHKGTQKSRTFQFSWSVFVRFHRF